MIVKPLFVSLPTPRDINADLLLDGYLIALEGLSLSTIQSVVIQLVKGTWREQVKFCPRPPELANMVRDEQRRIDLLTMPRLTPRAAKEHVAKDPSITHQIRADELRNKGYKLAAEGVDHDQFIYLTRGKVIPAGSIHLFAIGEVWTPEPVFHLVDMDAVKAAARQHNYFPSEMSQDDADYWGKIMSFKDSENVTDENMEFRLNIAKKLPDAKHITDEHMAYRDLALEASQADLNEDNTDQKGQTYDH